MARRKKSSVDPALAALEQTLGHTFKRPQLLTLALTHRSHVYDAAQSETSSAALADPSRDNEQLEFLGDSALGFLVAEALCRRFPASREGELTRLRATLVSRKHLGAIGLRLQLGRWFLLGQTAEQNGGRNNALLHANVMEALIAALYRDGGLEVARAFVEREILASSMPGLEASITSNGPADGGFSNAVGDHKSALQEMVQAQSLGRPQYILLAESGPDHRRVFRIAVRLDGPGAELGTLAEAEGSTKKQAQQEAARLAVARLREQVPA